MIQFVLIITALAAFIYYYIQRRLNYWKDRHVDQESLGFVLRQTYNMFARKQTLPEAIDAAYKLFPNVRYSGSYQFTGPKLLIKDPDLIKEMTVKHFENFMDHTNSLPENIEPLLEKNLVALTGQKWKEMRSILSPSFTSSKMRIIFNLMLERGEKFSKYFIEKEEDLIEVEMKDIFTRFTNDVIATTAFGVNVDSLNEQTNDFYMMGKRITNFRGYLQFIKFMFIMICPRIAALFKMSIFDKHVSTFFSEVIEDTIKLREEKGIVRPDMIHLLMDARKGTQIKDESNPTDEGFAIVDESNLTTGHEIPKVMTNMDIVAQAIIFFFAGFETVSSAMCFTAYELAANPDLQAKLRKEIKDTYEDCKGILSYEALLKMKYLDMIISGEYVTFYTLKKNLEDVYGINTSVSSLSRDNESN